MYKEQIKYQIEETIDFGKEPITSLIEKTEEIINSHLDKVDYCSETYVHPRLKRVPNKLEFLKPL